MAEQNYSISERTKQRILRMLDWFDGRSEGPPPTGARKDTPSPSPVTWVQIVEAQSGNGAYTCIIGKWSGAEFDPATDGADFDFYDFTPPTGQTFDAYYVNQAEEGKSEWWLDEGGHYQGWRVGIASDGLPIILGHVFDTLLCEEGEE